MSNPIEEAMEALGDVILRGINGLEIELEFAQHDAETWSVRAVEAEARVAELEEELTELKEDARNYGIERDLQS